MSTAIYQKNYYKRNREKCIKYAIEYQQKHPDKRKIWRKNSKATNQKYAKKWQTQNPEKYKQAINKSRTKRRKIDSMYRIVCNLRSRLSKAIKNNYKSGSSIKDLGCSISELKQYLEAKFQSGMTWDNYGQWHIDHIKPLFSFDLNDLTQFLQANHYTNLQPLWAQDHYIKSKEERKKA